MLKQRSLKSATARVILRYRNNDKNRPLYAKILGMDFLKLDEQVMELIDRANFDAAEAELLRAKEEASNAANRDVLDHVFSLLVMVQRSKQPPDLAKAELYCLERERVIATGHAKVQYAMTLYWGDDPVRAIVKAREAIAASKQEGDDNPPIMRSVCLAWPSWTLIKTWKHSRF